MSCKAIIFDMDGVLVDARELHYNALNLALESIDKKYVINKEEHLAKYDGLPTSKKLKMITAEKGLPEDLHNAVWKLKQEKTLTLIDSMTYDERMRGVLSALKSNGFKLFCASNSIRKTVFKMLLRKGLIEYFDDFISNQDVLNPKPHPEMYWTMMARHQLNPTETLVVEDSHTGREAAILSGATLCAVRDPSDVEYKTIIQHAENMKKKPNPKWQGGKLNVLVPMAGEGSRFAKAGYTFPKPLISVDGKPMIQTVVENLNMEANHIFVVRKEHYEKYNLKYLLNLIAPGCKIVQVDQLTEGAACTTLLAKEFIDNDSPLVFANSDQYLEWNSNEFMYSMIADDVDGGILTFESTHPKWSFAKTDENGFVTEVAEKKPISNLATCGIYYWKKGSDYVKFAEQMIKKNIRVNNEFYVCPVFNEAIADSKKIKTFSVKRMWGIGTPEDLNTFLMNKKEIEK